MTKAAVKLAKHNDCLDKLIGQEVNKKIRLKYTESEELAIHRHKLSAAKSHADEWSEYNSCIEECKAQVKAEVDSILAELEEEEKK